LRAHISRSRFRTYHSARWIRSLIKKKLKPILEILEECNELNWVEREKYWIAFYREKFDLTNVLDGGNDGPIKTRLGSKWSAKQRMNNRIARKGMKVVHTKEGNEKRKKGIRAYFDKIKKAVLQYDLEGNFIKEWASAVDAGAAIGVSYSNINSCCKSNKTLTAGGSQWKYKSGEIQQKINKYEEPKSTCVRNILQFSKDGQLFLKEYESIAQASKETSILRTSIINCLKKRAKVAGGYQWRYKDASNGESN
jgi:hypothetical protein